MQGSSANVVVKVERAHKGVVRSTTRVRCKDSAKKVAWVEVCERQDSRHVEIVTAVANAINKGERKTKSEAIEMKNAFIRNERGL